MYYYTLHQYGSMMADKGRMKAFECALAAAINQHSIVLDIGTGAGYMAMLAHKLGARHVYAIEPNPMIEVAKEMAVVNNMADRISFISDLSTDVHLPEPANVIVSDLRGALPLYEAHIPSIIDARKRLLAPDGIMIPQKDTIWGALVSSTVLYEHYVKVWQDNAHGFDLHAAERRITSNWYKTPASPEVLMSEPQIWATLDYSTIDSPNVTSALCWKIEQEKVAHGILLWFDTILYDHIGYSNAPGEAEHVYQKAFFPFSQPLTLQSGNTLKIQITATLQGNSYLWRWKTSLYDNAAEGRPRLQLDQSTFQGHVFSPDKFQKGRPDYTPLPNEQLKIDHFCLSRIDGNQSIEGIAQALFQHFPKQFANVETAMAHVKKLVLKYG